ncbi:MAG: aminoacetone oxidase family FAD-binding enzyme [bacterium]
MKKGSAPGPARDERPVDLLIVGGGASGLAAAAAGTRLGLSTLVLEKTDRCGHKLALTGGRKCNFTHAEEPRQMAGRFDADPRRLIPLFRRFPHQRVTAFFAALGIAARTDEQGRVWPHGTDGPGLRDRLAAAGGRVLTSVRVSGLRAEPGGWRALTDAGEIPGRNLLLATGGASHPHTGSSGDGLVLCRELGLAVTGWFPALCSLRPARPVAHLAGNARREVGMTLEVGGRVARRARGHFLFAREYVTGSAILNLSGYAARALAEGREVALVADWRPGLDPEELRREFEETRARHGRRQVANALAANLSHRFALDLCARCGVPRDRVLADLTRPERERVLRELKATRFEITGTEPIERATVTGGGLSLDEVDLLTGRVRRLPGLYAGGELLDTWAETGGYNLHFAWATGFAAAEAVAGKELE